MKLHKIAKRIIYENTLELIPLTIYYVSFRSSDYAETLYFGADKKKALDAYKNFSEVPDRLVSDKSLKVELQKAIYKYKYIDGEDIEDYPIEEYYDDESIYELIDEGDFDIVEEREIEPKIINKKTDEILRKVNSYFYDKYGRFKYNEIPILDKSGKKTACINLRISDHTENIANLTRYSEDRCKYFISVVIADSDPTEYKFKDIQRTSKDIQLKYTSEDNHNSIIRDIEKLIDKLKK